jgi:curved DNA-binding protein
VKDYYQILGVDRKATDADIKRAYRKLAGKHHPDRGGNADEFKEVQEAYDILSDQSARAQYDNPQGFFSQRQNFDDIMNQYFTQFDIRSQMRNTRVEMWVSMEDAIQGSKKVIAIAQQGVEIQVPPGIHDGEAIRYQGLAPGGGDLVIGYRVHGHPIWQRDGMDMLRTLDVNFWKLITGGEIVFSDVLGKSLNLKIPQQCKPGTVLRLAGQGATRPGHNNGDILIKIQATMPEQVPDEIIQLIHKHALNK